MDVDFLDSIVLRNRMDPFSAKIAPVAMALHRLSTRKVEPGEVIKFAQFCDRYGIIVWSLVHTVEIKVAQALHREGVRGVEKLESHWGTLWPKLSQERVIGGGKRRVPLPLHIDEASAKSRMSESLA